VRKWLLTNLKQLKERSMDADNTGNFSTSLTMRNSRGITFLHMHAFLKISSTLLHSLEASNKI